mgnify:CR=1 FL=1
MTVTITATTVRDTDWGVQTYATLSEPVTVDGWTFHTVMASTIWAPHIDIHGRWNFAWETMLFVVDAAGNPVFQTGEGPLTPDLPGEQWGPRVDIDAAFDEFLAWVNAPDETTAGQP